MQSESWTDGEQIHAYDGVIISGGSVDEVLCLRMLQEAGIRPEGNRSQARLIAADAGLRLCKAAGIIPAHIVGDFDSAGTQILDDYRDRTDVVIRQFQPEKDDTDTEIAVRLAQSLGWKKVLLLGGTGSRLDHVLGNIQVLAKAAADGCSVVLADRHNRISVHTESFTMDRVGQWGSYVSFFAWGGPVHGLSLQGFAYPLDHHELQCTGSLGVSNEITEKTAHVTFSEGCLVCVEARD